MAIAAVSIAPIGEGISVSRHVAAALRVLRSQERVRWRLDPMFTTLEGEISEILALVQRMQEAVFAEGALRVSTVIKIDERRDRAVRMEEKVAAVEDLLSPQKEGPKGAQRAGKRRKVRAARRSRAEIERAGERSSGESLTRPPDRRSL
jgi:uncharacterized protein (TIGR00106 family)